MAESRSLSLVALVIAVALLVINVRVIAGGQTWNDVRYTTEVVPPRLAAAEAIRSGELPAWWDGTGFGVPLLAEPSHGGLAPLMWLAGSQRGVDLALLAYLAWAALGVAVWARTRGASDHAALVGALLVAASGLVASTVLRGALPGLAHLPWLGAAATRLARADTRPVRARMTAAIAGLLGSIALAGELGAALDGIVIVTCICARRGVWSWFAGAVTAGVALGAIVWLPALLHVAHAAGASVAPLPLARIVELIVPARELATVTGAGGSPWAPSVFVGAPLIAFALIRTPPLRIRVLAAILVGIVALAGRGSWPWWLGAPELHLAALVFVAGAHAGHGVDALLAGERRALIALRIAIACAAIGLGAVLWIARDAAPSPAFHRAVFDGTLCLACTIAALVLCQKARARGRVVPVVLALLVIPSAGAFGSLAPTIARDVVEREPAFVAASREAPPPARLYRPIAMPFVHDDLADALGTLAGHTAGRWGLASAQSISPARSLAHDATWLAAANSGGRLLDRYGVSLAILPATLLDSPRNTMVELERRGEWGLVAYPAQPVAAVMRSWLWMRDQRDALVHLFPLDGSMPPPGQLVLDGAGSPGLSPIAPVPCTVTRWSPGAIDLTCTAATASYAVVTSSPSPGWTVTVDGGERAWVSADVLRRAVSIGKGTHTIAWRFTPPGVRVGALLSLAALLAVLALLVRRAQRVEELA